MKRTFTVPEDLLPQSFCIFQDASFNRIPYQNAQGKKVFLYGNGMHGTFYGKLGTYIRYGECSVNENSAF